ncbi:hydrogenase transcriptional regulatory protein hupR1 [Clostridium puniceum]|uniref:Stage 0 sporulation protein A homolog n=1 Tax=Clostridium puniceum TaxID=29367 RepID=A0A1S8TDV8_9CLOT|nr:HDOD domain-containing protein [Clostridium puniceum]OOM75973.1 hydrogenase transcriptional regulatory protein hupR1 [Clostridium puniceum]
MLKRILFVDDETQILRSITRLFMDTEYEVLKAESGAEALELLEIEQVDVIVSDMKMPKMTGYELLSQVKKKFPNIVRIILSGFSDERIVFDALQKNIAKLYILKPWENTVLINTIEKVFQIENLLRNNEKVLKLVNNAEELPTIKTSYQKIINVIESDKEIYKIVEAIEADNSIVIKLLHIVNSSYYSVKTGSIKRAVAYLGLDNIKNIVIASAFIDGLSFNSKDNKRLEELWEHAFIANRIISLIYTEFLNKKIPETEMNAGLLSNVGIIFMIHSFHDKYMEIFEEIEKNNVDIIELENKAFGTNHQEIGGYLLQWWDIPLPIVEAALYHHNPFNENVINRQIVLAAHVAEKYAWDIIEGKYFFEFDEKVFEKLKIDKEQFENKLKETLELSGFN